jgi:hypothetical protein
MYFSVKKSSCWRHKFSMHKKILFAFAALFIVILATPFAVDARHRYQGYIGERKHNLSFDNPWRNPPQEASSTPVETTTSSDTSSSTVIISPGSGTTASSTTYTVSAGTPATVVISAPTPSEITFSAYITGYSYWDNTPAGSADISNPIIHNKAGGTGTYNDPITLAVGHSIINGQDILDYPAGMKFYLPYLQKYVIVEDTCGDGNTPQNGPCHTGYQGHPWIDLYVDGANVSKTISNNCMNSITEVHTVIQNPGANYPVTAGSLSATGCQQY